MKLIATSKTDQNKTVVDPWTVVHFAAGLASGLMDAPLRVTLPVAILYELLEQELESRELGRELFETQGPESIPNAVTDVAVFTLGHVLGQRWNETR